MADNKLRIPRKLKTETHKQLKFRTDMNSDAPYGSAVQSSLIPLHGQKSWGQVPSLLLKNWGGGQNSLAPLYGIKFKKKLLFYFSMEAYIVHLAKVIKIFGQGYALKP